MLEAILQGLREVEGVQGAMVVDSDAAVVAHRAHAIYDLSVLQHVARSVVHSVESVQLIQDDWDVLTAHFGEGKLLLRSLRTSRPRRYILAVIADATLNVAFLGLGADPGGGRELGVRRVRRLRPVVERRLGLGRRQLRGRRPRLGELDVPARRHQGARRQRGPHGEGVREGSCAQGMR
jgi:predicted regulator of Ras-like GTPase activity (Roadblock/LC7/MglB family)